MRQECSTLPLAITVSIVVGHTPSTAVSPPAVFFCIQHGADAAKIYVTTEDRIDVIPVDYRADALLMPAWSLAGARRSGIFLRGRKQRKVCGYR